MVDRGGGVTKPKNFAGVTDGSNCEDGKICVWTVSTIPAKPAFTFPPNIHRGIERKYGADTGTENRHMQSYESLPDEEKKSDH